ncbi:MAG: primosomal protein N' [Maricaulaceae bacterium]
MSFGEHARVSVLFPLPLPEPFDYAPLVGTELVPGDRVVAPIGGRQARGVVWAVHDEAGARALKPVADKIDAPGLPAISRRFVDWVARYTAYPPGAVLRMALRGAPSGPEPQCETLAPAPGVVVRMTPARERVLAAAAKRALTRAELARAASVSPGVVKGLIEASALTVRSVPAEAAFEAPDPAGRGKALSPDQSRAADALAAAVRTRGFAPVLLDGVTGSGKTEVYFEAIAAALALRPTAQALILLPEIALTQASVTRLAERFGAQPAQWHSDISERERVRVWRAVAEGRARLVVGARSALFLPFPDLAAIVVDEEHDGAFKQDDGVIYHARDMAVARAKLGEAAIILASATPSLETLVNAQTRRFGYVRLPARPGVAELPSITLADLRARPPEAERWLGPDLVDAMADTLDRGEQVLLFLNRRGYAPLTLCRACGHRMRAPDTDSWLVEHRYSGRLVCHVTGFSMTKPDRCPECGAKDALTAVGPGVERGAEEARARFPQARVGVLSSDAAPDAASLRALIDTIAEGKIDIIVGTQMAAKGHNFPKLTLVGVVDADLALKGGDLRAGERTVQLLTQVAGRAGRADRPGRAILQTYAPDHEALQAIAAADRDRFLDAELAVRDALGLPPFGRIALIELNAPTADRVQAAALDWLAAAPNADGVELWGPAAPIPEVIRGRWRRRLTVRADKGVDLSAYVRAWRERVRTPASVRLRVDIDPVRFD